MFSPWSLVLRTPTFSHFELFPSVSLTHFQAILCILFCPHNCTSDATRASAMASCPPTARRNFPSRVLTLSFAPQPLFQQPMLSACGMLPYPISPLCAQFSLQSHVSADVREGPHILCLSPMRTKPQSGEFCHLFREGSSCVLLQAQGIVSLQVHALCPGPSLLSGC